MVKQGLEGLSHGPALCSDFCLSEIDRVTAHLFQIFYELFQILHLFKDEVPKHWKCPQSLALAHTIPYTLPLITVWPQGRLLAGILK